MTVTTSAYAALDSTTPLVPFKYELRPLGEFDVHVSVKYCGICHTDIHLARNEWPKQWPVFYPLVPGHEVVGVVSEVGAKVTKVTKGSRVGVCGVADSCGTCKPCLNNDESYCRKMIPVLGARGYDKQPMYGGFSRDMVIKERFIFTIPDNLDLAASAPLLCAGISVYAPMKQLGMDKPGTKIGVVGMGGLGHMAIKFAVAWGADVTVITRTDAKKEEALSSGAKHVLVSSDANQMKEAKGTFEFLVDTVSAKKDVNAYLDLLAYEGTMAALGIPANDGTLDILPWKLISGKKRIATSMLGGSVATQEMLNFCGEKNITCEIERAPMAKVNECYERVLKADVRFRFVLEVDGTLPKPDEF